MVSLKLRDCSLVGTRYESSAAAVDSSDAPPAEKFEYQTEVNRLMDLIVNSLYSKKEVFLQELVSNASDAPDELRYVSVTEPDLPKDGPGLHIRIETDVWFCCYRIFICSFIRICKRDCRACSSWMFIQGLLTIIVFPSFAT